MASGKQDTSQVVIESIRQSEVIPLLQKYLLANNHALEVNKDGICNGLAAAYCKYAAQGQEELFIEMLRKIQVLGQQTENTMPQEKIDESLVCKFIAEVLFTFLPQKFNKTLCQDDAGKLLKVDSKDPKETEAKPLKHEYNIGLVAKPEAWGQIFNRIKAEGSVMTVATPTHAIAISVKNGKFHVYDPNHNKIDVFEDTMEEGADPPKVKVSAGTKLAKALAREVFPENKDKSADLLALTINVFSHPEQPLNHQFPDLPLILKNISKKDTETDKAIDQSVNFNGKPFNSLAMAAMQNDEKALRILIEKGAQHPEIALQIAARDNRLKAIDVLLDPSHRHLYKDPEKVMVEACKLALEVGRFEALDKLLQNKEVKDAFTEFMKNSENQNYCLKKVASSGSPQCIEQFINFYEKLQDANVSQLIISNKAIELAQKSGNKSSVELLERRAGLCVTASKDETLIDFPQSEAETNKFIGALKSFFQFIRDVIVNTFSSSNDSSVEKNIETQRDIKGRLGNLTHQASHQLELEDSSTLDTESTSNLGLNN
ncbi:TPA: hypothetical protein I8Y89_001414 [Legionella pneumophila]|uniref:YopT-type cysteine protease domain-containing protein n=1 Tax=Legionella pneumophila TaxID=446 RepID=UPI00077085F4|nr:YopT-type cysteine protease domain-containing protein [Legionella pneumophila]MDW8901106.1 YopT-type cysteine protease domain-containing protein [Legionella pneumophila]MDW8905959.1 YopT-type cysteine protease domain-containing protein [Legionella pneumophila]MDW9177992.1 YopT-type cysteine protease domain-containing protein [Legionella pneumophila]TIG82729.1 hypothetical protein DI110_13720 [Legionella pneumophila]CZH31222.1 cysteine protease domain%2C YopT-type [Legionella pneumophila]